MPNCVILSLYTTLGVTVMHSVQIGGIMEVFAFLVIPSAISSLFAEGWRARIIIGWVVGTAVSVCGLYFSGVFDLLSGPAVILFPGIFLFAAMIFKNLLKRTTACKRAETGER